MRARSGGGSFHPHPAAFRVHPPLAGRDFYATTFNLAARTALASASRMSAAL
jgi:hypothetical protein